VKSHRLGGRRTAIVLILALALALRVAYIAGHPGFRPFADAASFDQVAVSLALHGHYPPSSIAPSGGPSALRPPAYPFALSALYAATGTASSSSRFVLGRLMSAAIGTVVVALVGLVAWLLWASPLETAAAMLLAAVYPPLVTMGDAMLSEPLFTALVLGSVASALMVRRTPARLRWTVLCGILVGLAALTRGNGIIIALPIAAGILLVRDRRRSAWRISVFLLVTAIAIAPWAVRNTLSFHQFVPISTQGGFTLAGTYNDVSRTDKQNPAGWRVPLMPPYNALLRPNESEAALERKFRSQALGYAGRHPGYVFTVAYFNLGRLMGLQGPALERATAPETGIGPLTSDADVYSFYLLVVLTAIAISRGALRRAPMFLWLVPVALVVSLIFVTSYMRYRLPIDPFLILAVAAVTGRGWRSAHWRRGRLDISERRVA
jgi:4-amino-4-deoxy-L-arabinose transferase-like glycosyltransferase